MAIAWSNVTSCAAVKTSCSSELKCRVELGHKLGSQQLDRRHDWLNLLAPVDPAGASTSSTLATPEGEEKRDFHSIKRYINLTAWQMRRPLEVAQCRDLMSPEPPLDWKSTDSRAT